MHSVLDIELSFLPKWYNWHNNVNSLLQVLKLIKMLVKNLRPQKVNIKAVKDSFQEL